MSQPGKTTPQPPPAQPLPPEPYPPYRRVHAWIFQAWLLMFLGVICSALIIYLASYIPR
jgi:hypothetical protein